MSNHMVNGISNDGEPWLQIIEHPQSRGFRFRYQCEGPSHGGLQGENSKRDRKTYPTVKIHNYKGAARIMVMLVTDEHKPRLHAHELMGKNCTNGICMVDLKNDKDGVATFPNLGIRHVTKKRVVDILKERTIESFKVSQAVTFPVFDPSNIKVSDDTLQLVGKQAEDNSRNMQLNVVRLCFRAYVQNETGSFMPLPGEVVSCPIYDSKSPGASALKICRMDKNAGCCLGGEEVFLLCDKVQKDDIAVRFFEQDEDGQVKWEGYGDFGPNDVHRQYAIVFKTPQYHDTEIMKPAHVHVQLKRISDGETSDPKPFTYYPQQLDQEEIDKKKKKQIYHFGGGVAMQGDLSAVFAGFQGTSSDGYDAHPTFNRDGENSVSRPFLPASLNHQASLEDNLGVSIDELLTNPGQYLDMSNVPSAADIGIASCLPQEVDVDAAPPEDMYMDYTSLPSLVPRHLDMSSQAKYRDFDADIPSTYAKKTHADIVPSEKLELSGDDILPDAGKMCDAEIGEGDITPCDVAPAEGDITPTAQQDTTPSFINLQKTPASDAELPLTSQNDILYKVASRMIVALHNYAVSGEIKHILAELRHLVATQDQYNDNCLHVAVIHNQLSALDNLLQALDTLPDKHVPSQYNSLMQTPLHLAILTRQRESIRVLLQHGADLTVVDRHGGNALHLAAQYGYTDCLEVLLSHVHSNSDKYTSCLNARDFQGFAPLHLAVLRDHFKSVRMLCEIDCVDVNIVDGRSGRTSLHHAIETNNLAIVGYLILEVGADVNLPMYDGNTALHVATLRNMHGIAALLMTADADPTAENLEIPMMIDEASDDEEGEYEMKEIDVVGCTPLDYAIDEKMVRILNGEPYTSAVCELGKEQSLPEDMSRLSSVEHIKSFYESGIDSLRGDIDSLDPVIRVKLAHELDPLSPGQDWVELSKRLGLAALNDAFKMETSPTKQLLKNYETLDGTIEELCACLESMGQLKALSVLDDPSLHQKC